jgi:hypothetical protein
MLYCSIYYLYNKIHNDPSNIRMGTDERIGEGKSRKGGGREMYGDMEVVGIGEESMAGQLQYINSLKKWGIARFTVRRLSAYHVRVNRQGKGKDRQAGGWREKWTSRKDLSARCAVQSNIEDLKTDLHAYKTQRGRGGQTRRGKCRGGGDGKEDRTWGNLLSLENVQVSVGFV